HSSYPNNSSCSCEGWLFDQPNAAQRSQPGWLAIENTGSKCQGPVDSRTLPAYIAGRPAVYFCETNPMFPTLQPLTARGGVPDTMVCSPIRVGIRVSCLSTTLGAFVAHPDGRRRFMVASHGFPQGGAVMHQCDERRVGDLNEVFPGSDISVAEVQEGVSFDTSDYSDVAPPRRMAPLQDLKYGNYAATDRASGIPHHGEVLATPRIGRRPVGAEAWDSRP
ncbi:hypothetical protein FN846DRAFT_991239, partial [Sphaerosporella brunnea]